jgi:serine/threonine protein kinase
MKILKIGDFGSSRPELIANSENGIVLSIEIGTPTYLAPEIINGS